MAQINNKDNMEARDSLHEFRRRFCETANGLAQAFGQASDLIEQGKLAGYKEAFEEVLDWAVMQEAELEDKVPPGKLASFVQEQLNLYNRGDKNSEIAEVSANDEASLATVMSDIGMSESQEVEATRRLYRCKRRADI
eukprot:TRINITY_DN10061_c0_g3_i2.p3 TRINITY_DN10061_c0_g3~~TRINITY_DN10061_c0_g3_i2.p3  ORF type:complete len:138 (+),score=42.15 TRINITY_DN10061_c0_g3_i2:141-554(+)